MANWKDTIVSPDTPLGEAIRKVDASGLQVALVMAPDDSLLGILTDGNIRRAVLAGKSLQVSVKEVMNVRPTTVPASTTSDEMLALMRRTTIHHLPLMDGVGRVVGLATLDELIGAAERPNWVVLMAGGLGTRLRPLTDERPKPLLTVGGKPILESILESFAEQGFRRFFLSVNYKAEMIRSHFGTGERWGVQVEYLHESTPLGTAGALSLLPQAPSVPLIVMNGDLLTRIHFKHLLDFHREHGAQATMCVVEHNFQVPYGVVTLDESRILTIDEKPTKRFLINGGIYVLEPSTLELIDRSQYLDMTNLFKRLVHLKRNIVAFPIREYWLDVGRVPDLQKAHEDLQ